MSRSPVKLKPGQGFARFISTGELNDTPCIYCSHPLIFSANLAGSNSGVYLPGLGTVAARIKACCFNLTCFLVKQVGQQRQTRFYIIIFVIEYADFAGCFYDR
jgi:hypothetical protein